MKAMLRWTACASLLCVVAGARPAIAVDVRDTTFLHDPALGKGRLVFSYADDLWTAKADGTDVKRLTSHPGNEGLPFISPDGKLVAFTGTYDGNPDVYVVPIDGGEPKRLTWHPGPDLVRGFTPTGDVLFASPRGLFTQRALQFFTVPVAGGAPVALKIPTGFRGAYSPDGTKLAYTPLPEAFRQWKHYRGGTASRIWVAALDTLKVDPIPQPEGRCNDTYPMWVGDRVYFLSDRDGEFNLYSYDAATKSVVAHTHFRDFPIEAASAGDGKIVYEHAGHLSIFDPASNQAERLKIGVAADLVEARPRYATGAKYIRAADVSPTGKRAVVEFRGEIVTVPAKKGDARNLTRTPGVHERSPSWSPDGSKIAYFSDASGEYALVVEAQDGKGETKTYALGGSGFYERPSWSPDGKAISYIDNSRTYYWIDVASGKVHKIAQEPIYGPVNTMSHVWSPDSKWIAYTLTDKASFQTLRLYSVEKDASYPVTDGLAEAALPAWDASGKYLYFLASTDAGPVKNWFDQSNADMHATYDVFAVVLAKATPNPLLKESDEEGKPADESKKAAAATKDEPKSKAATKDEPKSKTASKDAKADATKPVVIDLDGLGGRTIALPVPRGIIQNLAAGPEGTIYYVRHAVEGPSTLAKFDFKTRLEEKLGEGVDEFVISADRKTLLYRSKESWGLADAGKIAPGQGKIAVDAIAVRIEPRAEWPEMFQEAWRINRDYFYATNMHGVDWSSIREKYAKFLPEVPTREDLNRLIRGMCSEIAVGHSYLGGGDRLYEPKATPVGLLGADYDVVGGRYRIARIYGGLAWDPELKAPLTAPGVEVNVGDYLLAVDGEDVKADRDVYAAFENTVGRRIELKVGPSADGAGARTVVVEPIADESALRNRAWVESNLHKVQERTGGRVAYVYVPNTAGLGHAYFKRYFFPQADKDAIIVDERYNGGGSVADYYIDILRRQPVCNWATRYGDPLRTPSAAVLGPKVMLINESAGSGGDLLPWMFRKFQLGTLVGRRTWGGLVGILGYPVLMDGGRVTAPNLAFYNEDGWRIENEGVPPDVEVEQLPAEVAAGKDPQLDKAIEIILEKLKANPPKQLAPPAFPVRVPRAKVAEAK